MDQDAAPYPVLKCLTDKAVSLALLVLCLPLFLIIGFTMAISMAARRADRGSFFYRERRVSRGREFDLLKFRVLLSEIVARMPSHEQHSRVYEKDPANLTWAGRHLLKKWYFDELPQLFNILKGDMSLVGPRPWPISLVNAQLARGVTYRNLIRAGWTGPAQLQKRRRKRYVPASRKSEDLDLEYLERCRTWPGWRLWCYDTRVLGETLLVLLEGQGLKN